MRVMLQVDEMRKGKICSAHWLDLRCVREAVSLFAGVRLGPEMMRVHVEVNFMPHLPSSIRRHWHCFTGECKKHFIQLAEYGMIESLSIAKVR